jgi:hypothetical protein
MAGISTPGKWLKKREKGDIPYFFFISQEEKEIHDMPGNLRTLTAPCAFPTAEYSDICQLLMSCEHRWLSQIAEAPSVRKP